LKIAIIHDWLIKERGGEKVLERIVRLYPEADIYTLFYRKANLSEIFRRRKIYASILQHVPGIEKIYRYLLPIFPFLIEAFNLDAYDLVISSSHCVAKSVRVREGALHLCYCHTPMRYAWMFQEEYLQGKFFAPLAFWFLKKIRAWDKKTASRVHYYAANSEEVKARIFKFYNRESDVIYPPLDLVADSNLSSEGKYFLIVSALVRYKRIDLAVEAFNELALPLKIIGTGECAEELKRQAKTNIEFVGWVDNQELKNYYRNCKALVFPGHEDFGITPIEAQAAGKPVIAYGKGGVTETVTDYSGVFFLEQNKKSLKQAVLKFETMMFDSHKIRSHALSFNAGVFDERFQAWVNEKMRFFFGNRRNEILVKI